MKPVINRADIIGGLKSVKLAKLNPQNYQPGVGVTEDFELLYNYKKQYGHTSDDLWGEKYSL